VGIPIYQVDAFTAKAFAGNPAGVCLLSEAREDAWMQAVAAEMNLSETAFLLREAGGFRLRWFTPIVEVDLCGHATLATARVLVETGELEEGGAAIFSTRSGVLAARLEGGRIELDFPAKPEVPEALAPELVEVLGVRPQYVGRNLSDVLVLLDDEEAVRALRPDLVKLARMQIRGLIATAASASREYDFVSRFFAPAVGIAEDPVTGSAHCCLGPFWQGRTGRDHFVAYQASRRGGVVHLRMQRDRVLLGGDAVIVLRGELTI
jgi:PhzF family phenazine biosynthesis protein